MRTYKNFVNSKHVSQKSKEKMDEALGLPKISAGQSIVDGDLSGSDMSLDEELGMPSMKMPGIKKAIEGVNAKLRRSSRVKKPVQRLMYDGYVANHYAYMEKVVEVVEPTCFDDAIGNVHWEKVMDEEMNALYDNETWELVPLPKGKKSIRCKWVYKVKHNSDGSVRRYKTCLVAKGYTQTYGIDYEETFAPIVRMATMRVVIAVAGLKVGFYIRWM